MPNAEKLAKKALYFEKLIALVENHPNALIVHVDNVGSKQMQDIRMDLRGRAVVLMGKNTMIRKALTIGHERNADAGMENIRAIMQGNIGFIFATNTTLDDIRDTIKKHRLPAAAKAGVPAVCDVTLPSGPSGMDPSQTSFFQALNIPTKIVKGQIELISEFRIATTGIKVSPSEQVLMSKLGLKPFEYGLEVKYVFQDGCVFSAEVLDMSEDILIGKFLAGVSNMAAFSRELGVPTEAGLPHMFGNAFKNVAALCAEIDFDFKEVEDVKKFIKDPSAFASSAPAAAAAPAAGGKAAPAAKAAVVEEEEEEDMGFDLFG